MSITQINGNTIVSSNGIEELTIQDGLVVKKVNLENNQVWEYVYDHEGNLMHEMLNGEISNELYSIKIGKTIESESIQVLKDGVEVGILNGTTDLIKYKLNYSSVWKSINKGNKYLGLNFVRLGNRQPSYFNEEVYKSLESKRVSHYSIQVLKDGVEVGILNGTTDMAKQLFTAAGVYAALYNKTSYLGFEFKRLENRAESYFNFDLKTIKLDRKNTMTIQILKDDHEAGIINGTNDMMKFGFSPNIIYNCLRTGRTDSNGYRFKKTTKRKSYFNESINARIKLDQIGSTLYSIQVLKDGVEVGILNGQPEMKQYGFTPSSIYRSCKTGWTHNGYEFKKLETRMASYWNEPVLTMPITNDKVEVKSTMQPHGIFKSVKSKFTKLFS